MYFLIWHIYMHKPKSLQCATPNSMLYNIFPNFGLWNYWSLHSATPNTIIYPVLIQSHFLLLQGYPCIEGLAKLQL